jgi:hypothetical protein
MLYLLLDGTDAQHTKVQDANGNSTNSNGTGGREAESQRQIQERGRARAESERTGNEIERINQGMAMVHPVLLILPYTHSLIVLCSSLNADPG